MKSLLALTLTTVLPLTLSSPGPSTKTITLDPSQPIYLGDVFWPPTMTFLAWLPSAQNLPNDWCYHATDASNHKLFSMGGIDALEIHNYFDEQAYLTREGKRFAECYITPESGRMGACEGVADWECEGGHKYTGPSTRRWSCWVLEEERVKLNATRGGEEEVGDGLTTSMDVEEATKMVMNAAFTPGVTGKS